MNRSASNVPADALAGNPGNPTGEAGRAMLERMNESHGELTEWALGFVEFQNGYEALDVGCGGGATMQRIARRYAGGHVHGIDHSKEAVALARETNQKTIEAGRMTVRRASVERLPFESGSIDMAVSVESLYFWPRPDAGLGEICRVLRHGGQLVIALEAYENGNLPESVQANAKQFGLFMPTMGELRCLLREAGFDSVDICTQPNTLWLAAIATK